MFSQREATFGVDLSLLIVALKKLDAAGDHVLIRIDSLNLTDSRRSTITTATKAMRHVRIVSPGPTAIQTPEADWHEHRHPSEAISASSGQLTPSPPLAITP